MGFIKIFLLMICTSTLAFADIPGLSNIPIQEVLSGPVVNKECLPHAPETIRSLEGIVGTTIIYRGDEMIKTTHSQYVSQHATGSSEEPYTLIFTKEQDDFKEEYFLFSYDLCRYLLLRVNERVNWKEKTIKDSPGQAPVEVGHFENILVVDVRYQQGQVVHEKVTQYDDILKRDPKTLLLLSETDTVTTGNGLRLESKFGHKVNLNYDWHDNNRLCYRRLVNFTGGVNGEEDLSQKLDNCFNSGIPR